MNTVTVSVYQNHGHVLVVPWADVDAGVDKTYAIQGASNHAHEVTVTAADFFVLAQMQPVTVTSSVTRFHSHDILLTPEGP